MTSGGRRVAFLIGVIIAFMLPKRVDCGFPAGTCTRFVGRSQCTPYEVEPWGFYLIEKLARRDVGFAYSHDDGCQ
jgi:hypothetical protein